MAIETPSRHSFMCDGSTRVFPIPSPIKGDNYCRIEIDGTYMADRSKYDIVNNSIVFIDVADVPNGSQLDVLVVQSEEALGQLGSVTNIDLVAQNISGVNNVSNNIDNVNTVANTIANVVLAAMNTGDIDTVAANITGVNTVASNIIDVESVADNMTSVIEAVASAATATAKAAEASNSAGVASLNATSAANSASSAASSAGDAFAYSDLAQASATSSAQSATSAQASLDEFQGQYHGSLATAPTVGVDAGDLYFDTVLSEMRVYTGTAWKTAVDTYTKSEIDTKYGSQGVTQSSTDTTTGRLLKVGDFGVGTVINQTGVDCDLLPVNTLTDVIGSSSANAPTNGVQAYAIHTIKGTISGTVLQVAYNIVTGSQYIRTIGSPWQELYHTNNILGAVSQSGGVPTGAIIERGSNANGEYVKFADGTMICTFNDTAPIGNSHIVKTFPAAFADVDYITNFVFSIGNGLNPSLYSGQHVYGTNLLTGITYQVIADKAALVRCAVIGRWV
jgi:hypothetical protein